MNIKGILNKEAFGKLSEDMQKLYKADGDNYHLQVDGMVSKSKVDEFRDNNILKENELKALEKKFAGVDLDKWNEYKSNQQSIDDKKLIDAGKVDELVSSKVAAVTSDFTVKLENANSQIETLTKSNASIVNKYEIQGATSKAFTEFKIRPEIQSALSAQINSMFTVNEGSVVAMKGNDIITGKEGNLTINEFVGNQDDAFKIPSSGGQGQGGGGTPTGERSSVDKIRAGLSKAR